MCSSWRTRDRAKRKALWGQKQSKRAKEQTQSREEVGLNLMKDITHSDRKTAKLKILKGDHEFNREEGEENDPLLLERRDNTKSRRHLCAYCYERSCCSELPALLFLLGITEEGLADVSEQQVDNALVVKGIFELEECRRVKRAWREQQQLSGEWFKLFSCSFFLPFVSYFMVVCDFLASFLM